MATVIDALVVTLGLDPKGVQRGGKEATTAFGKVTQGATQMGKGVSAGVDSASDSFRSLQRNALAFFAVLTAGKTLKAFIADTTSSNVAAGNLARNLGTSVNSLTTWQRAAQAMGGSADDVSSSMGALVSQFQTIEGRRNLGLIFGQLHVNLNDANGQLRSMNELMPDLAASAQQLGPQLFSALGGQAGFSQGFINLLEQGPDKVKALYQSLQQYAPTERDTKASAQLYEDWTKLTAQSEAFGRSIMTNLSPEVHDLFTMINTAIDQRAPSALKQINEMGADLYKRFKEINWEEVGAEIRDWEKTFKEIDLKGIAQDIAAIGRGANDVAKCLGGWEKAAEILLTLWAGSFALRAIANVARFAELSIAGASAMARIMKGAGVRNAAETTSKALVKEGAEVVGAATASKTAGRLAATGSLVGKGLRAGNYAADAYLFMQYFPHIAAWLTGQGWDDEHPSTYHGNAKGLGQNLSAAVKSKQAYLAGLERQYNLPAGLLDGMWAKESSRGRNAGPSPAGALGDFQIMPDVARQVGVNPQNFEQSAQYAAKRMHDNLQNYQGSLAASLAEYNWGAGNLHKARSQYGEDWASYAPDETQDYIATIGRSVAAAQHSSSSSPTIAQAFVTPQKTNGSEKSVGSEQGDNISRYMEGMRNAINTPPPSSMDNSSTHNVTNHVTVNAPGGDPKAVTHAVKQAFNDLGFSSRQTVQGLA
ncbi:lytic transglycosylase domain-containing protein [Acetobacter syzygii]|uniref:lytic transglycosylase domain-containing protein n=1 Tax=Acetobacter syzygii TaxID=146476 RepID=UPI00156EA489|nr:lytic transglycosylase domain-containing protein [Acetobacter syzygii]NSL91702.1 lytic transglycosylase domain-containing protein [Acetobacter syzygii]